MVSRGCAISLGGKKIKPPASKCYEVLLDVINHLQKPSCSRGCGSGNKGDQEKHRVSQHVLLAAYRSLTKQDLGFD